MDVENEYGNVSRAFLSLFGRNLLEINKKLGCPSTSSFPRSFLPLLTFSLKLPLSNARRSFANFNKIFNFTSTLHQFPE
jgi:hypothetical protein